MGLFSTQIEWGQRETELTRYCIEQLQLQLQLHSPTDLSKTCHTNCTYYSSFFAPYWSIQNRFRNCFISS